MTFLDDSDLAWIREYIAKTLPDEAVITAKGSAVSDGAGGWRQDYAPRPGGTVACRLDPATGIGENTEIVEGEEITLYTHLISLPHDTTLNPDDRIRVNGVTYEVVAITSDHSWRGSVRATLKVMQ